MSSARCRLFYRPRCVTMSRTAKNQSTLKALCILSMLGATFFAILDVIGLTKQGQSMGLLLDASIASCACAGNTGNVFPATETAS